MACECGEQYQRAFPANIQYHVYFDQGRKTAPVRWAQDVLSVCTCCGEITSGVPTDELRVLREGAGEPSV